MEEERKIFIVPPPPSDAKINEDGRIEVKINNLANQVGVESIEHKPKVVIVSNVGAIDITNVTIRNENVQEILTKIPHWLIRRGNLLLLISLLLVLFLAWFIKYPTTLAAEITLRNEFPNQIIIKENGYRIDRTLVKKNQRVTINSPLFYIKSDTDNQTKTITATTEGRVNFLREPSYKSKTGEKIAEIESDKFSYYAIGNLNSQNIGSVKEGQKIRINLANYGNSKVETVFGIIYSVYWDDKNKKVVFYVHFSEQTNKLIHQKFLSFNSLDLNAEIITEDKRLLSKFFAQI